MDKSKKLAKRPEQGVDIEIALQQRDEIISLTNVIAAQGRDLAEAQKQRDTAIRLLDSLLADTVDAKVSPETVIVRKLCSLGFQRRGWLSPTTAKRLRGDFDARMELMASLGGLVQSIEQTVHHPDKKQKAKKGGTR
jgi:hypothetical protein